MKKTLLITALLFAGQNLAHGDAEKVLQKHKQEAKEVKVVVTETIDGAKVYGDAWKTDTDMIEVDVALKDSEMNIGEQLTFKGNIGKVCQSKGCWMTLEQNGMFARVDFNNHSFFIPKDSSGKAEVYGVLKSNMMSEEKRKHLEAEGSGKMPEKVFEIKATSVKIYP